MQDFLARVYVDGELRSRFLADPAAVAKAEGFSDDEAAELAALDRDDLLLAARSFERKRDGKARHRGPA